MYRTANTNRMVGFAVTTAMAGALLSGCSTMAAPHAVAVSQPVAAKVDAKQREAIARAEAVVAASPQDAGARVTLAQAYLDAGRFSSAATTFNDAMTLGDTAPRTALSLSLALIGEGNVTEAGTLLNKWEGKIPAADLGLALALSGQAERGIYIMEQAVRGGENNAKMRQNLAYAYALAGRWREARLMASQDVPADKVGDRMEQWAMSVQPEAWQTRVAGLLDVPAGVRDAGQPVQLALNAAHSDTRLAAAQATAVAAAPQAELPALAQAEPTPVVAAAAPPALAVASLAAAPPVTLTAPAAPEVPVAEPAPARPTTFASAFAEPAVARSAIAAVAPDAAHFARAAMEHASRSVHAAPAADGTHLIQLGSFASEQGAHRAWSIYTKKYPELSGHQLVVSEAVVRGKHYWRVSAAGYGLATAAKTCGRVKDSGGGCLAWAEGRPLPGAIDRGIRLASR